MSCKICFLILFSLCSAVIVWLLIEKIVKPYIKSKMPEDAKPNIQYLAELPVLAFFGGFLEIFLYSGSFLIGKPEFILLWLGVKTALKWDRKRNEDKPARDVEYRGLYYSFLIGNATTILLGYIVACLVNNSFIHFNL